MAGVQPIPLHERLSRKKIIVAGHLMLGLGVGGLVGQGRGLVDREINCKKWIWSGKTSGTQCARKGYLFVDAPIGIPDVPSGTNFTQHPPNTVVPAASSSGIYERRLSRIPM